MLTFTITLSVFPAGFFKPYSFWDGVFTSEAKKTSYHQLTVGLIFNIFDTVGRQSGSYIALGKTGTCILGMLRIGFLFVTIAFADGYIKGDFLNITNLVLFSVTNGFVSTRCCILGPQQGTKE